MMPEVDHYATLGLAQDASVEEVRRAFKARSRVLHPDRHAGAPHDVVREATRLFQDLTEAYRVLGNAALRECYDQSRVVRAPEPHPEAPQPGATPVVFEEESERTSGPVRVLLVVVISVFLVVGLPRLVGGLRPSVADTLETGDCVSTSSRYFEQVECGTDDAVGVRGTTKLEDGDWPGDAALDVRAMEACTIYRDGQYEYNSYFYYPSEKDWKRGVRTIVCMG
jgi:preprotein translocase subunit Sec63